MIPSTLRAAVVCAVLMWVCLPNRVGAQVALDDAPPSDALKPLLGPRLPQPVAAAPLPDELPAPRLVNPDAPPSPPLEVIDFRELALSDAMRLLSQQTGLNIVPSGDAGKIRITFYAENMTPENAVSAIAQAFSLITRLDPTLGVIRIFTTKEYQLDLASFREEETEVFTLLYPNALNIGTAIRNLFGTGRVQLNYGGLITDQLTSFDLQQRFNRFDLIGSRGLGLGIFNNGATNTGATTGGFGGTAVSVGGGVGGGGVGGATFGGGGLGGFGGGGLGGFGGGGLGGFGGQGFGGAAGQRPGGLQQIIPIDKRLEGLTPDEIQALQEAWTKPEAERSAAILDILSRRPTSIYVTVIEAHNQLIVRTSDTRAMQEIRNLVSQLDVPTPVVLLEVKVLSINLSDEFTSVFDFQFTDGLLTSGSFTTGNILPPFADMLPSSQRRFAPISPGPLSAAPSLTTDGGTAPSRNFVFQVVSANFRARLQLLEDKNRVTELATPLLMTANNEVSRIFSGVTTPITTGFTPSQIVTTGVSATSTVLGTPVTTLQDIGTTLLITPNVNADRTVTLRILEENSTDVPNGANIPIPNPNGTVTQVPVDTVSRETITGTVVAMDGQTLAFGGLIDEKLSDNRQEVPVLGHIPYLGVFFRAQDTIRTRTELVILIRPFVLTTPCESQNVSRTMLNALSIHPNVPQGGLGTLGTFVPAEVLHPNPPMNDLQRIFKVHTIVPKDY